MPSQEGQVRFSSERDYKMSSVFVSFDYENDRHYKRLLEAWHVNPRFQFVFQDASSGEINSSNVAQVRAGLTRKIFLATHTLVIIGRYANTSLIRDGILSDIRTGSISRSQRAKSTATSWWPSRSTEAMSLLANLSMLRPRGRWRSRRMRSFERFSSHKPLKWKTQDFSYYMSTTRTRAQ